MRIGPIEAVALVLLVVLLIVVVANGRVRRPAGEALEEIFGEAATPQPGSRARLWALGVLHEAGVDPDSDPGYAVKLLRQAEPRLSPAAAKLLVDTLNRD